MKDQTRSDPEETPVHRICFECDHRYLGELCCPSCGAASGEPLPDE